MELGVTCIISGQNLAWYPVGKAFESSRFLGFCRVKRNHEISINKKGILVNIHVQLMHYFEEVFGKMQIIKEFKLCLLVKFI